MEALMNRVLKLYMHLHIDDLLSTIEVKGLNEL